MSTSITWGSRSLGFVASSVPCTSPVHRHLLLLCTPGHAMTQPRNLLCLNVDATDFVELTIDIRISYVVRSYQKEVSYLSYHEEIS